jgi:hypothetical protein
MKKLFVLAAFLVFTTHIGVAQMLINWQQSFGGMNVDCAYDIAQTEGGYLVAGNALSNDGQVNCYVDGGSLWLLKIDNSGNLLWQMCYENDAYRIIKAIGNPDYYLVGGVISEPYPDDYNLWISKIDSLGNIIWERTLGNSIGILGGDQYGEATNDGGVIATAQIDSQGGDITNWYGGYDGWIIKLDSTGNTEWDFSVGTSQLEFINCIIQTGDNGYLAGLYGTPNGIGGNIDCDIQSFANPDAILFKLDADGNPEWHHCYGGSGHDGVVRLLETENGYMVAAFGGSNDGDLAGSGWHGEADVWLVQTDFSGNIIWQKCYGGSGYDSPKKIFQTSDGGFMVFANTTSFDGDVVGNPSNYYTNSSIWVFKIDSIGELQWQQCIGGETMERVYGVSRQGDYDYTVAGEMRYSPTGDVNCSNFVYGSQQNYWVFGVSDTIVGTPETSEVIMDLQVFPNPATNSTTFSYNLPIGIHQGSIEVRNTTGQLVASTRLNEAKGEWVLHLNNIPSGLYIYTLSTQQRTTTGKLVVSGE